MKKILSSLFFALLIFNVNAQDIEGCTDPEYLEYYTYSENTPGIYVLGDPINENVNVDDGSCQTFLIYGCGYEQYLEYDPEVNIMNTDACINFVNSGCTDANACNYDIEAMIDDGTCIYADLYYNCDGGCINDIDGNGICDELEGISSHLYPIEDPNLLAFLQDSFPQVICNDSLDIDATNGIGVLNINSLELTSIDGIQFFSDLYGLACWGNQLTYLPELPQNLDTLVCSNNQLTSLPELPQSLTYLSVWNNQLSSLPELPQSLTYFICSQNQLISLPELPQSLTYFICSQNQLTSLPELPQYLTYLHVGNNQLTSLPELPQYLTFFSCSQNELTSLPELPEYIIDLWVWDNQLSSLPDLPQNLDSLDCSRNQLTSLPELPQSLTHLSVWDNQLTSLPELPQSLTYLSVWNNQLTSLPVIPNNLVELYCAGNQITQLPLLPIGLIFNNDLPLYHFSSNLIQCVTNYLPQFAELYEFPLCNSYGCTDPNACNYNASANQDDGFCLYGAENVFLNSILDDYGLLSNDSYTYFQQGTSTINSYNTSLFVKGLIYLLKEQSFILRFLVSNRLYRKYFSEFI